MGIFDNVPLQAVYRPMAADTKGLLDGSRASYTLTFAKSQLPSVKYFWSVTMYRMPERQLVEN
jgi:hypothetical protein